MTTIAFDAKGFIAADSQTTFGNNERAQRPTTKIVHIGDALYAFAGLSSAKAALIQWHASGADPDKQPKFATGPTYDWYMLVIRAGAPTRYYHEGSPYGVEIDPPFALGSGGDYALGAMGAGADAKEAVVIATHLDVKTGGEIQVVNIAEALRSQIKEAAE